MISSRTDAARPADSVTSVPLVRFEKAAVRLGGSVLLRETDWEIRSDENWAVIGPNGAGKSTLAKALAGLLPVVRGRVVRNNGLSEPDTAAYVSFETHRRLIEREEHLDHARYFSGNPFAQETVQRMLEEKAADAGEIDAAARRLGIIALLDRSIRTLSNGEMRKALIARALLTRPRLLILDEPFEGLDAVSRKGLKRIIENLISEGLRIVLITHRAEEIPTGITHVLRVEAGRVAEISPVSDAPLSFFEPFSGDTPFLPAPSLTATKAEKIRKAPPVLIDMRDVHVRYNGHIVFEGLNWQVKRGENWAVLGPNGAGKTTLLGLIAGDHPQAYANKIWLFGKRRGSGESIWDIKRRIGLISPEFQIRYRKRITALEVVISGFFDSVGLYRRPQAFQRKIAAEWISRLSLNPLADRDFTQLSQGEQRMILIARAMVKKPNLLILDEPCQGLDPANRRKVIDLIGFVGSRTSTQVIYVTHHAGEIPECVDHRLMLGMKHD